ncbi:MAG: Hpt domain-containing protein [Paracoccaceae bacterium]
MIDWNRVRELHDDVGAEDFAALVDIFLDEADEVTARLGGPPENISTDDLHFLRGAMLNLGFRQVSALCQTLETRIAGGDRDAEGVAALLDAYKAARAEFLRGTAGLAGAA